MEREPRGKGGVAERGGRRGKGVVEGGVKGERRGRRGERVRRGMRRGQ